MRRDLFLGKRRIIEKKVLGIFPKIPENQKKC